MKKIRSFTVFLLLSIISSAGILAQPVIELRFQGLLTDGNGQRITGDSFEMTVKLTNAAPGQTELWKESKRIQSDEDGWIAFTIPDVAPYIMNNGNPGEAVVISLECLPNNQTRWLGKGEDFMVSYTLTPSKKGNEIHLKMTRMEGSELTDHFQDNLSVFKDEYPFAYLTGGFLLSDTPPVNESYTEDLKEWIAPSGSDEKTATRGIRGGFVVGGNKKK